MSVNLDSELAEKVKLQKIQLPELKIQLDTGFNLNANEQVSALMRQVSKKMSHRTELDLDKLHQSTTKTTRQT